MKRDDLHGLGLVLQLEGLFALQRALALHMGWLDQAHGIDPLIDFDFWPKLGVGAALFAAGLALVYRRALAGPALLLALAAGIGHATWLHGQAAWGDSLWYGLVDNAGLPAAALGAWALSSFRFVAGPRTRAMAAAPLLALPLSAAIQTLLALPDRLPDRAHQLGTLVPPVTTVLLAILALRAARELTGVVSPPAPNRSRLTLWVYAGSFGLVAIDGLVFVGTRYLFGEWVSGVWTACALIWCASLMGLPWLVRGFAGPPPATVLDTPARRSDAAFALAWFLAYVATAFGAQLLDTSVASLRELAGQPPVSDLEALMRAALVIFALGAAFAVLDEARGFARVLSAIGCLLAATFAAYEWLYTDRIFPEGYQTGVVAAVVFGALVWCLPHEPEPPPPLADVFT